MLKIASFPTSNAQIKKLKFEDNFPHMLRYGGVGGGGGGLSDVSCHIIYEKKFPLTCRITLIFSHIFFKKFPLFLTVHSF